MGIKISAPDTELAIASSELFKCTNEEEVREVKQSISEDLTDILVLLTGCSCRCHHACKPQQSVHLKRF